MSTHHPRLALPVSAVAMRAEAYSSDDKTVLISLTTKYYRFQRSYSVPHLCFDDHVMDLQNLNLLTDTN